MNLLFVLYIILSFGLAYSSPRGFFVFYILASTKFLGFFDAEAQFIFNGLGIATPALNIVIISVVLVKRRVKYLTKKYRLFTHGLIGLLFFGILSPVIVGYESVLQAIIASKELWSIFLFIYLVVFRNIINLDFVIRVMVIIGVYICSSYILNWGFSFSPPFYYNEDIFRAYFPTYISLAWFITYYIFLNRRFNQLSFALISFFFFSGLFLAGHIALTLSSSLLIIFHFIVIGREKKISFKVILKAIIALGFVFFTLFYLPSINARINTIANGEDRAFTSRAIYNKYRWKAISERPLTGYGFIHKSADITTYYTRGNNNRFMERFEVIDSGYVDILIKFGIFGLIFIIVIWFKPLLPILKRKSYYSRLEFSLSLFLIQFLAVNYTWSVFTYSHGLIPGLISMFIIKVCAEKRNIMLNNETYNSSVM